MHLIGIHYVGTAFILCRSSILRLRNALVTTTMVTSYVLPEISSVSEPNERHIHQSHSVG